MQRDLEEKMRQMRSDFEAESQERSRERGEESQRLARELELRLRQMENEMEAERQERDLAEKQREIAEGVFQAKIDEMQNEVCFLCVYTRVCVHV